MPPKHGQSQLISPVSGLNAASWPASSSSSWGDFPLLSAAAAAAAAGAGCALGSSEGFCCCCCDCCCSRILGLMELRVGRDWSSSDLVWGFWSLVETIYECLVSELNKISAKGRKRKKSTRQTYSTANPQKHYSCYNNTPRQRPIPPARPYSSNLSTCWTPRKRCLPSAC